VKDNFSSPLQDIPGPGDNGRRFQLFVELCEAHHEIGDDVEGDVIRSQRPIQTGGLCPQVNAEDFIAATRGERVAGIDDKEGKKGKAAADVAYSEYG
jgi:hypothetical protein